MLHPKGKVSEVQEAQMTTILDKNVHNVSVEGSFDDCQDIVKALFADPDINRRHKLGAVNSISRCFPAHSSLFTIKSMFRDNVLGVISLQDSDHFSEQAITD